MKKKIIPVIVLVLLAAGVLVWFVRHRAVNDRSRIPVSGNVEVTEVQVSFMVAGRVLERLVDEGQVVKAGDIVARLDRVELEQVLEQAKAALAVAEADAGRMRLEFARQKELFGKKVIASREFEIAEAANAMAEARVKESRAALALAETRLGYAALTSPVAGVVLSKAIESGEYVFPGTTVVTIGNLGQVWIRAYINETDLGRVKVGQAARVMTDTYPGKNYSGVVAFISSEAEFTPKNVQTAKERVKLVYRIKIDVANPAMELKPGMPADAVIGTVD
ncbi:MAG: efflux RND transporter periplasmic adaptor subunit [Kiritimatiellae bacterium]|nr:efflux RND transporter periplasmic adaptor subunit [Kiritimatiellia bacterium]